MPRAVAALAAGAALVSGCDGGSAPEMDSSPPGRVIVKPGSSIELREGGGDVPDATAQVCRECQIGLEKRQFEQLARDMDQKASAQAGAALSDASAPSARAVALVCAGAAKTNLGRYQEALQSIDAAEAVRDHLPAAVRPQLLELLYHAELISAASVGDVGRAREAFAHLTEIGGKAGADIKQACEAAPDRAALPECTIVTSPPVVPGSPTGGQPSTSGPPTPDETGSGGETASPEPTSPDTGPETGPESVSPDVETEPPGPDPDEGPSSRDTGGDPAPPIES
ncbi:hypothetical protein [Nonomuraea insulae]|uniref:Uncharacterized protein n=1 Tax=Nonomuraea insulae TaxID=1616787 RepID=A0ABW1CU87_9ACTN